MALTIARVQKENNVTIIGKIVSARYYRERGGIDCVELIVAVKDTVHTNVWLDDLESSNNEFTVRFYEERAAALALLKPHDKLDWLIEINGVLRRAVKMVRPNNFQSEVFILGLTYSM